MSSGFEVCVQGASADMTRAIRKCAGFVDKRPVVQPRLYVKGRSETAAVKAVSGPPDFDEPGFLDGFVVGGEG